jgi:hypothetical protein
MNGSKMETDGNPRHTHHQKSPSGVLFRNPCTLLVGGRHRSRILELGGKRGETASRIVETAWPAAGEGRFWGWRRGERMNQSSASQLAKEFTGVDWRRPRGWQGEFYFHGSSYMERSIRRSYRLQRLYAREAEAGKAEQEFV